MNQKPVTIDTYRHRTTTKATISRIRFTYPPHPTRLSLANIPCTMAKLEMWKS